jgi:redox-sensitive bicupin YhaK (pirin superfamily)
MIQVIPANSRYLADHGWLTSRFSFSFAEYYDPNNIHFGALRVFNDDTVQSGRGFPRHPHEEMEIMSYVISGELEHQDSMGNKSVLHAGEIQMTTAGTGIQHSEYNPSSEVSVHFLQLWFIPDHAGLKPVWEQRGFPKASRKNQLFPVVSGTPGHDTLLVHQDLTVYLSDISAGDEVVHRQLAGRKMYLFIISGQVVLNDAYRLVEGDSARITETSELRIMAVDNSEILLIDLI